MTKVLYSPKSKQDLITLKGYITTEFDAQLANDILKKIMTKIERLEQFPLMGQAISNIIDVPTNYMYLVIEKNYVFYRHEDAGVKIIRVLNTRQDFIRILLGIFDIAND